MKSRLLGRLFVAASALPSVACSNDLPRASRIDDLRVVAVHADQPYAHPGETVSLDALAVDPKGRAITWGWATCEDPDDSSALGCIDALQKRRESGEDVRLTTGAELDRFDVTVDADILSGVDPAHLDRSMIGVVVVACPGILDDAILADTSAADPVPVSCRDPVSGEPLSSFDFVVGTKRLFVREKDRNSNPVIDGVFFDGAPWPEELVPEVDACTVSTSVIDDCPEGTRHAVQVNATSDSFESGTSESGEPFTEQLVVQYYATGGTFADDVRIASDPGTKFAAGPASGAETNVYIVLRDNRGGVTWAERRVKTK